MAETLITLNQKRWNECKINPSKEALFTSVANRLMSAEALTHYRAVEAQTGVPWWFIAVVHEREASQRWTASLAQGDRWDRKSIHVPAGRGPFKSWEEAAIDALVNCAPYAAKNKDWSPGGALTMLEKYNGLGYASRGIPSPYIWAGTNQYTKGKFVADHVFDENAVDTQLGCAGLLMKMGVFNKVSATGAGVAGAIIATGAGAVAAAQSGYHWGYIIGGVATVAIIAWILIHNHLKGKIA